MRSLAKRLLAQRASLALLLAASSVAVGVFLVAGLGVALIVGGFELAGLTYALGDSDVEERS